MAIFGFFKRTAEEWFRRAQRARRRSMQALPEALFRDVDRYRSGAPVIDGWGAVFRDTKKRTSHYLDKALKIDPDFVPALIAKAEWIDRNDPDKAIAWLDKAIALSPDMGDPHFLKGMVLDFKGARAEAVNSLRRATECDPHDAEAWYWLSRVLASVGNLEESKRCEGRALAIDPHVGKAPSLRARWMDL